MYEQPKPRHLFRCMVSFNPFANRPVKYLNRFDHKSTVKQIFFEQRGIFVLDLRVFDLCVIDFVEVFRGQLLSEEHI